MATNVTVNGVVYSVPGKGALDWAGANGVDGLLISLANNAFKTDGGNFFLLAEVDFGATAGLKAISYKSRAADVAQTGILRMGNTEKVVWRNAADSADLPLTVNAANELAFNGNPVMPSSAMSAAKVALTGATGALTTGNFGWLSSQMLFPDGTKTLPSIAFTSNADLGLYLSGASALSVSINDTQVFTFEATVCTINAGAFVVTDGLIRKGVATGTMEVSADTAAATGGNALFYASSHATKAGDFEIRNASTNIVVWDQSASLLSIGKSAAGSVKVVSGSLEIEQPTAGDVACLFDLGGGTQQYVLGIDDSAGDIFSLCVGSVLGSGNVFNISTSGILTFANALLIASGTDAAPGLAFSANTGTGIYRSTTNRLSIATAGVQNTSFDAVEGVRFFLGQVLVPNGSVSSAGLSFFGDSDTGIYTALANRLSITAGGSEIGRFSTSGISCITGTLTCLDGAGAATPGFAFSNDLDTGIYRPTTNRLSISTGGVEHTRFDSIEGAKFFLGQVLSMDGTVSAPAYSFTDDPDTGIYRVSANLMALVTNGATAISINSGAVSIPNGDLTVTRGSTGTVTLGVTNSSATSAAHAVLNANCGSTSSGDPKLTLTNTTGGTDWYIGKDNSDSSTLFIGTGSAVGTNGLISVLTTGRVKLHSGLLGFVERSTPTTPPTNEWNLYFKTDGLYFLDDAGTEYKVTAV